ncbi:hypothetical protein XM52_16785 [Roseovarius indicus]|uniref:Uncharacterized protein n=1 Tax=Roseovarius indicus TaxID=540747 RepID=A0A0T5P777_9RHOB|nr:hypothetical protein XM52_16785 [Roseovarius indicus]
MGEDIVSRQLFSVSGPLVAISLSRLSRKFGSDKVIQNNPYRRVHFVRLRGRHRVRQTVFRVHVPWRIGICRRYGPFGKRHITRRVFDIRWNRRHPAGESGRQAIGATLRKRPGSGPTFFDGCFFLQIKKSALHSGSIDQFVGSLAFKRLQFVRGHLRFGFGHHLLIRGRFRQDATQISMGRQIGKNVAKVLCRLARDHAAIILNHGPGALRTGGGGT